MKQQLRLLWSLVMISILIGCKKESISLASNPNQLDFPTTSGQATSKPGKAKNKNATPKKNKITTEDRAYYLKYPVKLSSFIKVAREILNENAQTIRRGAAIISEIQIKLARDDMRYKNLKETLDKDKKAKTRNSTKDLKKLEKLVEGWNRELVRAELAYKEMQQMQQELIEEFEEYVALLPIKEELDTESVNNETHEKKEKWIPKFQDFHGLSTIKEETMEEVQQVELSV